MQNGEFYAWLEDRYGNSTRAGVEKWKKFFSQVAARPRGKRIFSLFYSQASGISIPILRPCIESHSIMSLNHAKKVWNYQPQKSMKFFPRGGGIFILFLGWEEFYNINSYYFRVTINFTENYVKVNVIVWIYVIKFFSPRKKYENSMTHSVFSDIL